MVENMGHMFRECSAVTVEDVRHFDTSKVTEHDTFMSGTGWESLFG